MVASKAKGNLGLIIVLIAGIVFFVSVTTMVLYQQVLESERQSLLEMVNSQAQLIESVRDFDAIHSQDAHPDGAAAATLEQFLDSRNVFLNWAQTGELLIARRDGTHIQFMHKLRFQKSPELIQIDWDDPNASPMRNALNGNRGSIEGIDYFGSKVLAAYRWIDGLGIGLVAKKHIAEIRRPFLEKALILNTIIIVFVLGVAVTYFRYERKINKEKVDAENRLKESLDLLELFFKDAHTCFVLLDRDFNFIRVNEAYAKVCAKSVEDFPGHNHFELYPSSMEQTFIEVRESKEPFQISARPFSFPDHPEWGTTYWDLLLDPILDKNGEVELLVFSLNDVTERVRAESALRESEERYRSLIEATTSIIWTTDESGKFVVPQPSWEEYTGQPWSEHKGFGWTKKIHPDDIGHVLEAWEKSLQDISIYETGGRIWSANLKEWRDFEVRATPIMGSDGSVREWVGIITDITERKKVEEEYRMLIESSHEVIFSKNRGGHYHTINLKAAVGLGGACIEDIVGKTDYDLMPEKQADALRRIDQQVMDNEEPMEIEEVVHIAGGEDRVYLSRKWPTLDNEGKVSGIACFAMDITKIKAVEAELDKYRYQLEALVDERTRELEETRDELVRKGRLAALGQLTATVSHELRNPLAAMYPALHLIRKRVGLNDDKLAKAIDRIERNVFRCDRIIDEMLDFTRITDIEYEHVVLDEWLEGILAEQPVHEGIQLSRKLSLGSLEVDIDPGRLRRAVENVIENACHAMREGEDPDSVIENARLNIFTERKAGRVEIRIQDTGAGIPEDVLPKIFEPLYSTKSFGVGLGMPVIKQIMEQHGGGIEIDTEEGKGTSVTMWILSREGHEDDGEIVA